MTCSSNSTGTRFSRSAALEAAPCDYQPGIPLAYGLTTRVTQPLGLTLGSSHDCNQQLSCAEQPMDILTAWCTF